MVTLLIKNVQLIDGTCRPPVKADVLIKNKKISAIGSFSKRWADEVIDGLGAYLSPGFIDINTDSDHYLTLFSNPGQQDFLLQGVTTIIGGQCGASLAPLVYGSLDSISEWTSTNKVNVNWHTVKEFLDTLGQQPLGVNFGTLVGHNTIRQALTGGSLRDLSRNELRVFTLILDRALREGAFGFSTGLGYANVRQTPYSEVKALVEITAKHKKFYATHLRNEKRGLLASVNETIEIAKETGAKILISHFRPLIGSVRDYDYALELIDKNANKADIYFDLCPLDSSNVLVYTLLPDWAQEGNKAVMLKDMQAPGLKEKIIRELPAFKGEEMIIVNAPNHEYLEGKSLKEFSQNRDLNIREGLLNLMKLTNFRAVVFYKNVDLKKVIKVLSHNRAIMASNSASFTPLETLSLTGFGERKGLGKNIRVRPLTYAFTKFLELAEKEKILPIETAIYKITGLPAKKLNISYRGIVRENYFADLVIFRDAEIKEVIVNGKRVVKDGKFQNILAGEILKHEA